ncbi:PBS lyase HEAT domain protein repeat-containing protein [Methanosphaerula palustris E1-9c]|uniref:PBS lyase HEAT domain protein repeat-containing protein n=2 Tax=Methanosphaerula palustris TaxID=475088 RepID=B8GFL6_METPE|nr:PBS lyase HEAT domain protein repeat-containing protein [Methanosphaerula palustris E1-9c]
MTDPQKRNIDEEKLIQDGYLGLAGSLENSPDPHIRQYAAHLLGGTGEERALPNLLQALHDPEKGVRNLAMQALVNLGTPAVDPLLDLLSDHHWVIRYRAVEALGLIGDPRAVRPLVHLLSDEKDHVRYMAAKGLGRIGGPEEISSLIHALSDNNEFVRRSAATALGAVGRGDEQARTALHRAAERETDPAVKTAIAGAIRTVGDGQGQ